MRGGRLHDEQIDEAIRVYDKLLLVVSEASMTSGWVRREIRKARQDEATKKRRKLFPIRLVSIDAMEISPDGAGLRPRSRFARFTNLPELQQMFRAFSDVQTAEMPNLPRPRLETGKPIVVSCPMSEEQTRSPAGVG